jgi:peptidoglycan-associated lipoprotein
MRHILSSSAIIMVVLSACDTTSPRISRSSTSEWLKKHKVGAWIERYADERGTAEYNMALGLRRAYAVRDYLVGQGVPSDRIATISYGTERPALTGSNEAAWQQNRRAHTVPNLEPPPPVTQFPD